MDGEPIYAEYTTLCASDVDGEPIYAEYTTLCASDLVEGGPAAGRSVRMHQSRTSQFPHN